jgi:hypothetical protein
MGTTTSHTRNYNRTHANPHTVILRSRGPSKKDLDDEGSLHSAGTT